jgi:hypothetical protein
MDISICKNYLSRVLIPLMGGVALALFLLVSPKAQAIDKVCFCHNIPHHPHTICTADQGLINGHDNHLDGTDDTEGECSNCAPDDTCCINGDSPGCECGNGKCDDNEDCSSCPDDCGQCEGEHCGNGKCEPDRDENCSFCPQDCGECTTTECTDNSQCSDNSNCTDDLCDNNGFCSNPDNGSCNGGGGGGGGVVPNPPPPNFLSGAPAGNGCGHSLQGQYTTSTMELQHGVQWFALALVMILPLMRRRLRVVMKRWRRN